MGEEVFPKKENSVGLVAITLAGRYNPHSKANAHPLKNKTQRLDFFSASQNEKLAAKGKVFINQFFINGRKVIRIEKISNPTFLYKAPLLNKKKTERQSKIPLIIPCKIFFGFLHFITIFFARLNRLFKIQ